ncbi:hypothetical protein JW872_02755 [Candidatus Babeliales bacterium]|nr:hypothetical protein [Candidatus Babeliales bacterium]
MKQVIFYLSLLSVLQVCAEHDHDSTKRSLPTTLSSQVSSCPLYATSIVMLTCVGILVNGRTKYATKEELQELSKPCDHSNLLTANALQEQLAADGFIKKVADEVRQEIATRITGDLISTSIMAAKDSVRVIAQSNMAALNEVAMEHLAELEARLKALEQPNKPKQRRMSWHGDGTPHQ